MLTVWLSHPNAEDARNLNHSRDHKIAAFSTQVYPELKTLKKEGLDGSFSEKHNERNI